MAYVGTYKKQEAVFLLSYTPNYTRGRKDRWLHNANYNKVVLKTTAIVIIIISILAISEAGIDDVYYSYVCIKRIGKPRLGLFDIITLWYSEVVPH